MGGVFSSPKVETVVPDTSQADVAKKADEERVKSLERKRRGIEGNIKTSYTGMLDTKDMNFTRKKLLGE